MPRPLPSPAEAARILAARRTRPTRRPAPPAGRALTALIKTLDERFGQGVGGLRSRWREIVGEPLARCTEPVKLVKPRGGGPAALELKVDGPAAILIQHQAPMILQRVALVLGSGQVDKLRIVQGPVRPLAAPAKPAKRRPAPLDAAIEQALAAPLTDQPPTPLTAALLTLGRAVMRRGG